jgi:hypothetical protein
MAHRIGIDLSDLVAGIAVVEGTLPDPDPSTLPNAKGPISVVVLHGSNSPFAICGAVSSVPYTSLASQDQVFSYWTGTQANRCAVTTPSTFCTGGSLSGSVTERDGTQCQGGTAVSIYELIGGYHAWFDSPMNNSSGIPYNPNFANPLPGITTDDILWNFFAAHPAVRSKPGIFRSGFYWLLDSDGDHTWSAPPDLGTAFGGIPGDLPITGDWTGDGYTKIGIYRPSNGLFLLDSNGDGVFDAGDATFNLGVGVQPGDIPVVGDWNGDGRTKVGLFRQGFFWILDTNGDGVFQQDIDATYAFGGVAGDIPIVGDWNGSGTSKIGLFRLGFYWILDANGTGILDNINGFGGDQAFAYGGIPGDVPVVGDWNGSGASKVGVFRQGFFWVLDANGNHTFDGTGPGQDFAFPFGGNSGDVPVVGKW